jgi:hypothetical protein
MIYLNFIGECGAASNRRIKYKCYSNGLKPDLVPAKLAVGACSYASIARQSAAAVSDF